ncbi:MAG: CDC48 family AAA ATPase [Candidatus Odinarchaeia archaeon]
MSESKKITVKVAEALNRDVGRNIARLDPKIAKELGVSSGDAIEIIGNRRTAALVWPGLPEDYGKGIIRIDGSTRRNAGTSLDEKVEIRRIEVKPARSITFAPTEAIRIQGAEDYLRRLLEGRVLTIGDTVEIATMTGKIVLVVVDHTPKADSVLMNYDTDVTVSDKPADKYIRREVPKVHYEDIGGLQNEIRKVREIIELPLTHPELFSKLGIEAPKGVLLYGPPGTGKTLLAKAVANESNANFYSIGGPEIMSKFYGESESRLREIFEEAEKNAPSIIFIDEIDSIAPKREEVSGDVEKRVVAQLLSLMDGLKSRGKVVVIGATNRPNALDPALRRGGRFDREIEIGIPDKNGRREILQIHTRGMPLDDDVDLDDIAERTHGFVGADIATLCKEAAMIALRRVLPEIDISKEEIPAEILEKLKVTKADFEEALMSVEPSAMREVFVEVPNVKWEDIGGLEEVKYELRQAIEWPLKYPKLFQHMKAKPPKGILLYGMPGTGKTLLAKAVATETQANFISVKGPEFLSKWVGESEKAVRETFRKARQAAPCIIFFDEIDAITPARGSSLGDAHTTERIISQLLTEMDGLEELKGVTVIAASNRPDIIDPALLRPGRFDRLIYIPLPDEETRKKIFQVHLKDKPLAKDVDIDKLAKETEGYSGAEIAAICNEAVMEAIEEYLNQNPREENEEKIKKVKLKNKHFKAALSKVESTTKTKKEQYEKLYGDFMKK